jgi:hypothetical protein
MSLTVLLWLQSGAPAMGYVNEQTFSPPHFHGINGLPKCCFCDPNYRVNSPEVSSKMTVTTHYSKYAVCYAEG